MAPPDGTGQLSKRDLPQSVRVDERVADGAQTDPSQVIRGLPWNAWRIGVRIRQPGGGIKGGGSVLHVRTLCTCRISSDANVRATSMYHGPQRSSRCGTAGHDFQGIEARRGRTLASQWTRGSAPQTTQI